MHSQLSRVHNCLSLRIGLIVFAAGKIKHMLPVVSISNVLINLGIWALLSCGISYFVLCEDKEQNLLRKELPYNERLAFRMIRKSLDRARMLGVAEYEELV
jgi:hypothetical protein